MNKVFINAGHHLNDTGHIAVGGVRENDLVMKIRDKVKKLYPSAFYVPDHLDLRQSIDWVNERCGPDDIAIDLHLNANNNNSIRGVECYYADDPKLAEVFSKDIAFRFIVPNRGAIHDSKTWVGSLGWLRKLNCKSVLVEFCYLTNSEDREIITSGKGMDNAAYAIKTALEKLGYRQVDKRKLLQRIVSLLGIVSQLLVKLRKRYESNN